MRGARSTLAARSTAMAIAAATWTLGLAIFAPVVASAQTWSQFQVSSDFQNPAGIAAGPDNALWFVEGKGSGTVSVGRVTTDGTVATFSVSTSPRSGVSPGGNEAPDANIVAGPDGALWFTDPVNSAIGRITTSGSVTEFPLTCQGKAFPGNNNCLPRGITVGPDGALWFTMSGCGDCLSGQPAAIGRITTGGSVTTFAGPSGTALDITTGSDGALYYVGTNQLNGRQVVGRITTSGTASELYSCQPCTLEGITAGPDGNLWFTDATNTLVGRMTTGGSVSTFATPSPFPPSPFKIAVGPDGALWFTTTGGGQIGQITTAGQITMFQTRTTGGVLFTIGVTRVVIGPDGNLWVTETNSGSSANNFVAQVQLPPSPSPLLGAVLPASRSVQVGTAATAFVTIINIGTSAGGCGLVPITPLPASFNYQTTNPATNQVTGSPNTPVNIAAGGSQSFVFGVTPTAAFVPNNMRLGLACNNVAAAPSVSGLNTLLLSASTAQPPDIVALAATAQNDGIVHVVGTPSQGAFAVATVDVGASASITASTNTGSATLPVTLSLCQTNPSTGACLASPAASVTTTINANATPTFAVFVAASGTVAFNPAVNRVLVQFTDAGNVVRGETSVAVETQ